MTPTKLRGELTDLTPRELEVAALVASGKTNKQIAAQMGLSAMTVQNYRRRVTEKREQRKA